MSALISADRIPKAFITLTINAALLLSRFAVAACLAGESLALFLGEAFSRTSALCELRWEAESRGRNRGREGEWEGKGKRFMGTEGEPGRHTSGTASIKVRKSKERECTRESIVKSI